MTRFASVLAEAAAAGRAVGAFTCYDHARLRGRGAGRRGARRAGDRPRRPRLGRRGGRRAARRRVHSPPPRRRVCRCSCSSTTRPTRELIGRAAARGVDAVMADGSRAARRRESGLHDRRRRRQLGRARHRGRGRARARRRRRGPAPRRRRSGRADRSRRRRRPSCAASGVGCLAVSIGNVHGTTPARPLLDWARLERLRGRGRAAARCTGPPACPTPTCSRAVVARGSRRSTSTPSCGRPTSARLDAGVGAARWRHSTCEGWAKP